MGILLGRDNSGNYKAKISVDGVNPLTASLANTLFDSDFSTVRIIQSGDVALDGALAVGGSKVVTFDNPGFVPACLLAIYRTGANFWSRRPSAPGGVGSGVISQQPASLKVAYPTVYDDQTNGLITGVDAVVTTTSLTIYNRFNTGGVSTLYRAKYYLFVT